MAYTESEQCIYSRVTDYNITLTHVIVNWERIIGISDGASCLVLQYHNLYSWWFICGILFAQLKTPHNAKWSRKTWRLKNQNSSLAPVYALRLTWWSVKEGKDKGCEVFTQLRTVRRLRSDMWWQHSATLLTQLGSLGYWGRDCPRPDHLQACVPSTFFLWGHPEKPFLCRVF